LAAVSSGNRQRLRYNENMFMIKKNKIKLFVMAL
jgi:hypothetical protein